MPNIEADSVIAPRLSVTKRVHVAVGVIKNDKQQILVAKRAQHLHQGGLWEFPGGKVEINESASEALHRELYEELNITVEKVRPLIRICHDYPDKSVLLDVWVVEKFSGTAQGKQGQPLVWVDVTRLYDYPVPTANKSIIAALRLPREMMITGDYIHEMDFENRLHRALRHGIKAVQLRAHQCNEQEFQLLFNRAKKSCDAFGALLIANTNTDRFPKLSADGLHLTSMELMKCKNRPVPKNILLGASCHSLEEIQQAERIETDYITLGPVYETSTHPNAAPLGLKNFSILAKQYSGLVFALGGMKAEMLSQINDIGGFGVASISAWW